LAAGAALLPWPSRLDSPHREIHRRATEGELAGRRCVKVVGRVARGTTITCQSGFADN